jgi:predicted GIY-YIG superfamily endonuclease
MGNQANRFADLVNRINELSDDDPISWYRRADRICKGFSAKTHNKRGVKSRVYIILLKIINKKRSGYALYVGKTIRSPEERFQQHQDGYKASRYVKKYGVRLLPEFFEHLNPMSGAEATELEGSIAEALKKEGVPTYGGH